MKKIIVMPLLSFVFLACEKKKAVEPPNTDISEISDDSLLEDSAVLTEHSLVVQGEWNSRMLCTKSDCDQYVIGDRRNESWEFTADSAVVYANLIKSKKKLLVFKAVYSSDKVLLESSSDSLAGNKSQVSVALDDIRENVMKGTQTIIGEDNCKAVFSVELSRAARNLFTEK